MVVWRATLFFVQAEDGIRDIGVTGVQTCALPIYDRLRSRPAVDATPSDRPPERPRAGSMFHVKQARGRRQNNGRLPGRPVRRGTDSGLAASFSNTLT